MRIHALDDVNFKYLFNNKIGLRLNNLPVVGFDWLVDNMSLNFNVSMRS